MAMLRNINYLVLESGRIDEWREYFTDFLSMEVRDQAPGALKVRMDEQSYRFIVRPGGNEQLWAAGFEVGSRADLEALKETLDRHGVAFAQGSEAEIAEREVEDMIVFADPEGLRLEAVYNPKVLTDPPSLPKVPGGFVTAGQGFGHIAITTADLPSSEAFYKDVLGFRLSDYIVQDIQGFPVKFTFFHINRRHHTLALAGIPMPYRLHHFMVQMREIDVVGRALERAKTMEIPIHMELGRHPNDRMLSFYAKTPSDSNVEVGYDGLEITDDAAWEVRTYDAISEWGHKL